MDKRSENCLLLLKHKFPSLLSDFRRIQAHFEFKVDEDDETFIISKNKYRPEG
jgi:hypothetical protein